MDFSKMKDRLVDHRAFAEEQIRKIKADPDLDEEKLHELIYDYVLYKYNLFGEVSDVYVLDELARRSVAKDMKLSKDKAIAYDNKGTCDGATSAMNKKVLLLMAIQRELDIRFPLDQVPLIKDTKRLAQVVYDQLHKAADA